MSTATVTVKGDDGSSRVVSFNLGRLLKIERAVGKGVNEFVFGELGPFMQQTAEITATEPFDPDANKDSDVGGLDAAEAGGEEPAAAAAEPKAVDPAELQRRREETIKALRKVSLVTVTSFIAGCLDVDPEKLQAVVGPARLMGVFFDLASPFIAAVGVINSGEEPPTTDPRAPASAA